MTERTFGRVAGRIVRRKNKDGSISHRFTIVKNQRNWHTRQSEHVEIVSFGTIKDSDFDRQAKRFWNRVDSTIKTLINSGAIYNNSAFDICRKFESYIPRPTVEASAPAPVEKPVSSPDVAERLRERFKDLL
jgi:hypothetical protein